MIYSVSDFKAFYASRTGRVVRRLLRQKIQQIWPEVKSLSVLGCGYAVPYLAAFQDQAERVCAVMPAGQGVHRWPASTRGGTKNLVCLSEESELPFEASSMDRIILMHYLEYSEFIHPALQEIWRVLKPNGRLLVVVPNRAGLWARADWSPFGCGTPYSTDQICQYLKTNGFLIENTEEALFMPPVRWSFIMKTSALWERLGRTILPIVSGVHIVEVSKQLFVTATPSSGSRVRVRGRGFIGRPVLPEAT